MIKQLGPQILALKQQGLTYKEIQQQLDCSKGTISYHLGIGQKAKTKLRNRRRHPFIGKIDHYKSSKSLGFKPYTTDRAKQLLQLKIRTFFTTRGLNSMNQQPTFSVQDVIDKFGPNCECYLTGAPIDINKPRTYHFDHIIPVSKGGASDLDNLGICTREANMAKSDMTPDEFITLCQNVLKHHGYKITK